MNLRRAKPFLEKAMKCRVFYFVYEGKVKVHKHWDEEKELIIRFAKEGDIFGHWGLGNDLIFPCFCHCT